ncbi:hypothetical protein EVAR_55204_1 [Eumeta japonica]|uniref:Uncharacterized protein n=1 Tax=Eumeta variegata TaxID=151549 RepID=A0A4C1ZE77_EUMVA|nr:hypothetical protein EVAR_55204_1 [Eumeta japonica]
MVKGAGRWSDKWTTGALTHWTNRKRGTYNFTDEFSQRTGTIGPPWSTSTDRRLLKGVAAQGGGGRGRQSKVFHLRVQVRGIRIPEPGDRVHSAGRGLPAPFSPLNAGPLTFFRRHHRRRRARYK